jgi:hypothetical protein
MTELENGLDAGKQRCGGRPACGVFSPFSDPVAHFFLLNKSQVCRVLSSKVFWTSKNIDF